MIQKLLTYVGKNKNFDLSIKNQVTLSMSECRRAFKILTEQKMHNNILVDDSNSDLITRKVLVTC